MDAFIHIMQATAIIINTVLIMSLNKRVIALDSDASLMRLMFLINQETKDDKYIINE